MRFTPHRTISRTTFEVVPTGYNSLSDEEYDDSFWSIEVPLRRCVDVHKTQYYDEPSESTSVESFDDQNLMSALEKRMQNLQMIAGYEVDRLKEEERKRKELEEKLRKEAEERARKEAERLKKEAEEKAKKEAEEKAKKEAEEKAMKEAEEKAKKEAEEKAKIDAAKALAQKEADEAKAAAEEARSSKSPIAEFKKYKGIIESIKSDINAPVKADPGLKSATSTHKRKINPKFGQLTSSVDQLRTITQAVFAAVDETRASELAYKWTLNFIAKKIVDQAETEIRVKPEMSVALARLSVSLLCRYAELEDLLKARFVKKCPYVVGFQCGIDTEEGRIRMGWRRSDGKWEDVGTYEERMAGMTTLWCVICRTRTSDPGVVADGKLPWDISQTWMMGARLANFTTIENVHCVILCSWWESCARELMMAYGQQAKKLLLVICDSLTISVAEKKYPGAARLRILGEEWTSRGQVTGFKEMEP